MMQNKGKLGGGSGGGDGTAPHHPLIEGMFQSLPENGQPWTLDEVDRKAFRKRLRALLKFKLWSHLRQNTGNSRYYVASATKPIAAGAA
jgi:hypothetical protein